MSAPNAYQDVLSNSPGIAKASVGLMALCCIAFILVFYPGYVSFDVLDQLEQGRTGNFSNVSPPANALLLGLSFALSGSTAPLFLLNTIVLFASLAWIIAMLRLNAAHLLLLLAVLPLIPILPHLWTDVHLAAVLALATALMLFASKTDRPIHRHMAWLGVLLILCWATWVRHNAILAVLPLALLPIAQAVFGTREVRARSILVMSALVLVVALVFIRSTSNWVVDRPASTWAVTTMWDLQYLSIEAGEVLLPEHFIGPGMDIDDLQQAYSPNSAVPLFVRTSSGVRNPTLETFAPENSQQLLGAWLDAIVDNPLGWLEHRSTVFVRLFGAHKEDDLVYMVDSPRFLHPEARVGWQIGMHDQVRVIVEKGKDLGLFSPWISFLIALCAIVAGWRQGFGRTAALQVALLVSTALYLSMLLPLTPSAEQRYLLWPLLALVLAGVMALEKQNE